MIKKFTFLTLTCLLLLGCDSNKNNLTIVEFNLSNIAGKTVFIGASGSDNFKYLHKFKAEDSSINYIDTLKINKEGYFNLGLNRQGLDLYIEKGGHLKISANAKDIVNTINFKGDLSNENNYLLSKKKLSDNNLFKLEVQDFIKELEQYEKNLLSLLEKSNSSKKFREQEIKEIKYEVIKNKLIYPGLHQRFTGEEVSKLPSGFYAVLNNFNFTDSIAFKNSQTYNYPVMVLAYFEKLARDYKAEYNNDLLLAFLKEVDNAFPKGAVKDKLMYRKLIAGMKLNDNLDEVYNTYMEGFQNEEYLKMATLEYTNLKKLKSGNPAPNFNLKNYHEGSTQLKDLKGKYVYIDVWATWCVPCIAEIPALKKVAEKFPDIQFVSISIDSKERVRKWKEMVKKEKLPGIQLIAYQENKTFKNNYAIRGIPRYILIDKNGTIVSANAFRPSNPKLIELLNSFEL